MKKYTCYLLFTVIILCGLSVPISCSDSGGDNTPDFDRTGLLENMADHLIIPAYNDLNEANIQLQGAISVFINAPESGSLSDARTAWTLAYQAWQHANAYNFGPAGAEGLQKTLVEEIGTFPVNAEKIEDAAASGEYSLTGSNRDSRGYLTVEYLLFGADESEVVAGFASAGRKDFLQAVVDDIVARVDAVLSAWQSGYRDDFVANDGTDAGSSISMFYNEFVRSYETIKNYKLGLPLGLQAGQTSTEPTLVEAYYSGRSVRMLKQHVLATEEIWRGGSGIGFDDYLQHVTGGDALIQSTNQQLTVINSAMDELPESPPLSQQVESAPAPATALHTELQKNTRYFKSDLSSLLGIAITFSSGDGD